MLKVVVSHYVPINGVIYDIGASTGNIERALSDIINERDALFIPIEKEKEMAQKYTGLSEVIIADAVDYNYIEFDVAILFLSLMFIPPSKQKPLIDKLKAKRRDGGAIIVFDKRKSSDNYISTINWRVSLDQKIRNGAKSDDIIKKELSLAGIQRPIDPEILGNKVEIFRFGEFSGYILE